MGERALFNAPAVLAPNGYGAQHCNQTGAPIPSGPLGARQQPARTTAFHATTAGLVFNLYTIYAPSLASRPQSMLSKFPWPPDRGPSSCFLYFRCTQCSPVGGSEGPLPRRKRKANTSSSSPSFVAPPLSLGLQLADQWQQIVECRCKAHRRRCKTRRRCIPKFRRVASGRRSCREKRWCFVKNIRGFARVSLPVEDTLAD